VWGRVSAQDHAPDRQRRKIIQTDTQTHLPLIHVQALASDEASTAAATSLCLPLRCSSSASALTLAWQPSMAAGRGGKGEQGEVCSYNIDAFLIFSSISNQYAYIIYSRSIKYVHSRRTERESKTRRIKTQANTHTHTHTHTRVRALSHTQHLKSYELRAALLEPALAFEHGHRNRLIVPVCVVERRACDGATTSHVCVCVCV